MQQSSVKDEFNVTSNYAGADYSLQNLDSYYKNSSSSSADKFENAENSTTTQNNSTPIKSDYDSTAPSSSDNTHTNFEYPSSSAYYASKYSAGQNGATTAPYNYNSQQYNYSGTSDHLN